MQRRGNPKITDCKASDNWTCITFKPDLSKFGMTELDEDIVSVLRRRVYDMSGVLGKGVKVWCSAARSKGNTVRSDCKHVPARYDYGVNPQVFYNGERLSIKSFQEYVDLYLGPKVRKTIWESNTHVGNWKDSLAVHYPPIIIISKPQLTFCAPGNAVI